MVIQVDYIRLTLNKILLWSLDQGVWCEGVCHEPLVKPPNPQWTNGGSYSSGSKLVEQKMTFEQWCSRSIRLVITAQCS